MKPLLLAAALAFSLPLVCQGEQTATPPLALQCMENGDTLTGLDFGLPGALSPALRLTSLAGCHPRGATQKTASPEGALVFTRTLADAQGRVAQVTDRFTRTRDGVRWEVEIVSDDKPWSTGIVTEIAYPATADSRFWTTWGHPENHPDAWADPLVWQPFVDRRWSYQFLDWTEMFPHLSGDKGGKPALISIPMFTVSEPGRDAAFSFMQSPEDTLLDLHLSETAKGEIRLSREKYRLGEGRRVRFHMDLFAHPADVRAGLGLVVARYPQCFEPGIARAHELSGSCAYSGDENPVDAATLRKMGFSFNWKLSDDFPYMGHFIPPVKSVDEQWTRSCAEPAPAGKGPQTSCRQQNDYARRMKADGFHVLSYFNVTEYGKDMPWPVPPRSAKNDADLWKNSADYFYHGGLANAVLMNGDRPFYSNCYGAVIVDPGEPAYLAHLLEQVRRNNTLLPDTDGICIDRLDWLGHYNERGDDGVSWVNGKPARALSQSWQKLADQIAPELHKAGKVLFLNNCTPRIEIVGRGDGIFAEWATDSFHLPQYANFAALAAVRKPAAMWTSPGEVSDAYFQRCLYLGVFPIAPYPGNNHCLTPSAEGQKAVKNMYATGADDAFITVAGADTNPEILSMAYGPLLSAMRGKKWVLTAHCVETTTPGVKVNLFEVPGGYALPVIFGDKATEAVVRVRHLPGLEKLRAAATHPGVEKHIEITGVMKDGALELRVPLVRGCAMVRLHAGE